MKWNIKFLPGAENAAEKFDEFAKDYGTDGAFEMVLAACPAVNLDKRCWKDVGRHVATFGKMLLEIL